MSNYFVVAKVTGTSHFPTDMLRYDTCFPASQIAVLNMSYLPNKPERTVEVAKIMLGNKPDKDTGGGFSPGRWQSFGWSLKVDRILKL